MYSYHTIVFLGMSCVRTGSREALGRELHSIRYARYDPFRQAVVIVLMTTRASTADGCRLECGERIYEDVEGSKT